MNKNIQLMRAAAQIAAKTQCWIGLGCVIAKDGEILTEGWNKTLPGEEYCTKFQALKGLTSPGEVRPYQNAGCVRHDLGLSQGKEIEKVCSIHAEALAIAQAAKKGININQSAIYITSFPCLVCLRLVIASGIKKIFYMNDFYKLHHLGMLGENNIQLKQIPENKVWNQLSGKRQITNHKQQTNSNQTKISSNK